MRTVTQNHATGWTGRFLLCDGARGRDYDVSLFLSPTPWWDSVCTAANANLDSVWGLEAIFGRQKEGERGCGGGGVRGENSRSKGQLRRASGRRTMGQY